jgi:ABC-type maltose transport system permease subunit
MGTLIKGVGDWLRSLGLSQYEALFRQNGIDTEVLSELTDSDLEKLGFLRIILPLSIPGMIAAFILSLVLCWNEYFFAALLTRTDAKTLPVMVASQTGSQGINWWAMAALSTAAIAPLVIVGIVLERYIQKGLTAGAGK